MFTMNFSKAPVPEDFLNDLSALGYSNVQQLGQGGMGTVFRAYKRNLDRTVAIKVVSQDRVSNSEYVQRFYAEMRTMAALDHPAIVPVYDGGVTSHGFPYFTMKYIDGENLYDFLHRRRASRQLLTVQEVVQILAPIASALDYLAALPNPVVHRDIKPANILLPSSGTNGIPALLTDFGIAIDRESTRMTRVGMRIGTDGYIAPELLVTKDVAEPPQPDALSEQYSLGLVAFELLTGIYVRGSVTYEQWAVNRPVPELKGHLINPADASHVKKLNEVFAKALDGDPKKRFATASAFISALHSVEMEQQSEHVKRGAKHKGVPKKLLVLATAGMMVVAIAAAVFSYLTASQWEGEDAVLADTFPHIVSQNSGGEGWQSTSCEHREPSSGELARIACNSGQFSVVVAHFESVEARNAVIPVEGAQTMRSSRCSALTMPMGSGDSAYGVFPQGDLAAYGFIVSGDNAEDLRLKLPIC